jgi:L-seryl-tRNA(Ser) seleniumtransferase
VIFSGDKLLGGPQAGCLAGSAALVAACRANPLARALRADKLTLAALEATLALSRDPATAVRRIPVLGMLTAPPEALAERAERLARRAPAAYRPRVLPGVSVVGGGAFPDATLPTSLVALEPGPGGAEALATRLRAGDPPLVARVADGCVLLDPRTLPEAAESLVGALLQAAAGADPT